MNNPQVKLPFSDYELKQLAGGHPVTEAAAVLQDTIIKHTDLEVLSGLELGSGNGIISLMLASRKQGWDLTGIELQPTLVELARENNSGLRLDCSFRQGDLRDYEKKIKYREYDLVYANPPWVKAGSGKVSPDEARALSRQEITCTMQDILACLDWSLNETGTAWLIYPNGRRAELMATLEDTGLIVKEIFQPEESPPSFVVKLARKTV